MVAKFKGSHRKVEKLKSNKVFEIPFLPLFVFLVLIIILLILPPKQFTGKIVDTIAFSQTEYGPREFLNGNLNIELKWGDHIPANTDVKFIISKIEGSNVTEKNTFVMQLPQAIALSETPYSGNYSYGQYRNVNGPSPDGEGYGFDACFESIGPPPNPNIIGLAAQSPSPPIEMPDLTVTDIYTQSSSPGITGRVTGSPGTQLVERLYAKIANIGTASTRDPSNPLVEPFTVEGCWITPDQVAPDCFFEQDIAELGAGQDIILDMGEWDVQDKTVRVTADTKNVVVESKENNNYLVKSFGVPQQICVDEDNGDYFVYGVCHDDSQLPFIKQDSCINNSTLLEFYCPSTIGLCSSVEVTCNNGCINGACREQGPSPTCQDSDGGNRPYLQGTCTDNYGEYNDLCLEAGGPNEPNIAEFYCLGNNIVTYDSECSEAEKVECKYIGSESEGWYYLVNGEERLIKYEICAERDKFKPICLYEGIISEGWYTPDVCDKEESYCNYGCVSGSCKISNYSCDSWNNFYTINFSKLMLRTEEERGDYQLKVALVYSSALPEDIILYSVTEKFKVLSHRACQNYKCVWVAGSEPGDQCDEDFDCKQTGGGGGGGGGGGACNENWQFTTWGECIAGQRTRECYDARYCGTTYAKPTYCLPSGNKFIQTESCVPGCEESWQCSEWSYCNQETKEQSAICEDLNKCNPLNYTYIQLRDCCVEQWNCKWGQCIDGIQEKVCIDVNNCGTDFTKPSSETKICKGRLALWTLIVIGIVVILAVLLILYATKVIKFTSKVKVPAEEEAHFTEVKV